MYIQTNNVSLFALNIVRVPAFILKVEYIKPFKTYQLGVTIRDDQCESSQPGLYSDLRRYTGWIDTVIRLQNPPHVPVPHVPQPSAPRPGRVEGNIQAEMIGKTVNSFFGMVPSIFNYLDEED